MPNSTISENPNPGGAGQSHLTTPAGVTKPTTATTTPTQPTSGLTLPSFDFTSLRNKAQDTLSGLPQTIFNRGLQTFGTPAQQDTSRVLTEHGATLPQQMQIGTRFNQTQQAAQQGNYLNAYQGMMGMMGDLKQINPNLPQAMRPMIDKHYGSAMGGFAPQLWSAANAWHGMVGNPQGFAQTFGALTPGLIRGASQFGGALGPLGLYGLISGNTRVLDDLRNLVTK